MLKHFLLLTLILFSTPAFSEENGCGGKYSSLVVDEGTGNILYEKRSDDMAYPASLVKMMTLYLTFEALENRKLDFDKSLTVSAHGEEIARVNHGNTLHLREGDQITVKEAVSSVIVKSFNEAAVTLAEAISGSEWEFVRKMNEKAAKLGMSHSSFRNASGLHEVGQYTTSYDLARLAIAIKKDFPQYYPLFAMKKFSFRKQQYASHNHVLMEYKGAEGMKTGFTNASGFNLVSAAKKDNSRLISIVLGCPTHQSRDKYTKRLLDICFKKLHEEANSQPFVKLTKGFDYCPPNELKETVQEDESEESYEDPATFKTTQAQEETEKKDEELKEEVEEEVEEKAAVEPQKKKMLLKTPAKKPVVKKVFKLKKPAHTLKKSR